MQFSGASQNLSQIMYTPTLEWEQTYDGKLKMFKTLYDSSGLPRMYFSLYLEAKDVPAIRKAVKFTFSGRI